MKRSSYRESTVTTLFNLPRHFVRNDTSNQFEDFSIFHASNAALI